MSIAHPIYVNPSLEFTFTADTVCKGEATTFTYSVLNPNTHIVAWNWNFGDGNTSIAPNPIHQYALAGNYNVSLTVLDSTNCMETITKLVHVFSLPLADFTVNNVCLGSSAVFYDYSSGMGSTIVSREWNFGDGNIVLGGITHTHTYANTGSYTCHLVIMNANGCIDTVAKIVNVIPIPQANFSFADACFGNNTLFTDNSNSNNTTINTWLWNFGDSNTFFIPSPSQYVQQVSHFYNSPGIYQASLIISNSTCGDTASYTIVIDSIPEAHFIATSACFGDSTQFTDQSIRTDYPIAAWFWTFGDGFTSTLQSPSHLYTSTGNFLVSLTVTDTKGCKDSIQQMVTVNSLPVADFSFVPANVGSPVAFSDLSIPNGGVISAWLWDFGDGNFSSLQNPSNVYANPGFYNVVERVTNIWGCWDTASQTVMVNSPFIAAAFTFVTGCVGSSTIFTDSSSIGWGSIIKWWWNFGDGFSSVLQNPTHTYSSAGTYIVSLIVEGSYSNFDTIYHTIEVHSIPTANFTSSAACVGALTNFTNASGVVAGNIIVSNWDFGDGSTSSAFNTYNIYADTGSYPVRLIVISDMGCTDTITKIIIISAQPEVHFSSNVTDGCEPLFVTFYDSSFVANGLIGSWFWNFGDGNTSNSPVQAAHSYLTTGIYDVTLKVISESGCANMLTINNLITVHPNPTADFSHSPDWVTDIDGQVWFTDLSFGASNWNWDFGNGAVSYVQSPATIYTQQGSPIVTLVVSNTYGCKDTARHVINVYHDDAFYIPNAFTPTSDNLNSYFGPYGEDLGNKHFSMTIWDRWGGLVFSTNNYAFLWDGKSKNGTKCAIGTYVYKIFLDDKNGESKVYQGYVTLVK